MNFQKSGSLAPRESRYVSRIVNRGFCITSDREWEELTSSFTFPFTAVYSWSCGYEGNAFLFLESRGGGFNDTCSQVLVQKQLEGMTDGMDVENAGPWNNSKERSKELRKNARKNDQMRIARRGLQAHLVEGLD